MKPSHYFLCLRAKYSHVKVRPLSPGHGASLGCGWRG